MKKLVIVPLTAILLLIGLPSLLSTITTVTDASQDGDIEAMTDEFAEIVVDETKEKLTAPLIAVVCGLIAFFGGLLGFKIVFR